MKVLPAGRVNYAERLARAGSLSTRFPFAAEVLGFYRTLAGFQKILYEELPKVWGKHPIVPADGMLRSEINLRLLVPRYDAFLKLVQADAPSPLAAEAGLARRRGEAAWGSGLEEFWHKGLSEPTQPESDQNPLVEFLHRAFLQPYAEFIVGAMLPLQLPMTVCRCPRCNSLPLVGILRQEGDGAKRSLFCSFCSQEWEFRRILCPSCGEDREEKLPVYVAEQFPHMRVEACDNCRECLRTVDLTREGHAVPLVDDLAAIPLSFWAQEQGYSRIQSNLLGT